MCSLFFSSIYFSKSVLLLNTFKFEKLAKNSAVSTNEFFLYKIDCSPQFLNSYLSVSIFLISVKLSCTGQ